VAQRSYIPQLVRRLNWMNNYITKHNATIQPYLSSAQSTALANVQAAAAAFVAVIIRETP